MHAAERRPTYQDAACRDVCIGSQEQSPSSLEAISFQAFHGAMPSRHHYHLFRCRFLHDFIKAFFYMV